MVSSIVYALFRITDATLLSIAVRWCLLLHECGNSSTPLLVRSFPLCAYTPPLDQSFLARRRSQTLGATLPPAHSFGPGCRSRWACGRRHSATPPRSGSSRGPGHDVDQWGGLRSQLPLPPLDAQHLEAGEGPSEAALGVQALGVGRACQAQRVHVVATEVEVSPWGDGGRGRDEQAGTLLWGGGGCSR